MKRNVTIQLKINNWDTYNPRQDYKKPWWFACSNTIAEDPDLFSFSHGEFKTWIYILGIASRKKNDTILCNLDHAHRVSMITPMDFSCAVDKLSELQMVTVICTDSVRNPVATLHNITEHNNNAHPSGRAEKLNFEKAYEGYPRKIGKARGMSAIAKQVKTQDELNDFCGAVLNYATECRLSQTEEQYIKHFSSFVVSELWRDYVNRKPVDKRKMNNSTIDMSKVTFLTPPPEDAA